MHLLDEFQDAFVCDPVVNEVGILAEIDNSLAPQDVEMLGHIRVRCLYTVPDFSDRQLLVLQQTEDLEADRMGHGFEQF